ncbi:hypothetical protein C8A03DRAFT_15826 [Achaetomium macrosporum]|uniref:C3H1-type domain-containing protein n=1 Tax=Achaetomium macrosporum TaxID=79813 RepID=A0AAN7HAF8_9PEZI|nr:hypothetical protein C8A03DRAFT_15826 [Achaetomium macrosporum]
MDGLLNGQAVSPTAALPLSSSMTDFVRRYQSLSAHRDSQEELIKPCCHHFIPSLTFGPQDLIVYSETMESSLRAENTSLMSRLRDAELDLEDATRSRRELQQQIQQLEAYSEAVLQDRSLKNSNPYVTVLIDGDCLLFKEALIGQGIEGGKKAAYTLRAAILEQCGSHAGSVEVIAKVYANLTGLARAMRRDGCLSSESDLKDFSLGFTQAKASFDFVDVGHGKERADNKIMERTKWHLRNSNCKQVILGISHDAGYAPFLDELFQDPSLRIRVTVLEGYPTVRELVATGVNILNLNDRLFRSEKLVDRAPLESCLPPAPSEVKGTTASVTSASISTPSRSVASPPMQAPATTYARAIKNATPPPQITLPIQPKPAAAQARPSQQPQSKPTTGWNPGPRGLDPPLQVSQAALDAVKKRRDNNKLCNNHYLRGPCTKGDACMFEHRYKPTKEELVAIAFLTRLNPCSKGQECEVVDCIYGHHCPSVRDGACTHPFCKFAKEDHPPGTRLRVLRS